MKNQLRSHLVFGFSEKCRLWWMRGRLGHCGQGVFIEKNVSFLRYPSKIIVEDSVVLKEGAKICVCNAEASILIGKRTTIGYHTLVFASKAIHVGQDCMIAPFVHLVDSDHGVQLGKLMNEQPNNSVPIMIGNDVWIGSHCTILKGVSIGDGAVIGANSVVNQNIPPNEIWAGVPVRKIAMRSL